MDNNKNYKNISFSSFVGLLLAGLAMSIVPAVAQEEGDNSIDTAVQLDEERLRNFPDDRPLIGNLERLAPTPPKWIGLACRKVSDLVRAHVQLPETVGLVVQEVVPKSPSDKIGLQKHDILIKAHGQEMTSLHQLVGIVHDSPDEGFELAWIRQGKTLVAQIVPVSRPGKLIEQHRRFRPARPAPHMMGRLQDWIDRLGNGEESEGPLDLRFFGDALPLESGDYPLDLRVQIQREGNETARLKVQRGDDSWELSEDDLDQLPDDLRPYVKRMLGGSQVQIWPRDGEDDLPPWSGPFGTFPEFELQMDEMHEQIQRIFEELKDLRGLERFQKNQENQAIKPGADA